MEGTGQKHYNSPVLPHEVPADHHEVIGDAGDASQLVDEAPGQGRFDLLPFLQFFELIEGGD